MRHPNKTLKLQVVVDLVCPWCFIGNRSLAQALPRLAAQGVDVEVEWLPYLLNPDLPEDGMDRKAFRTRRFGWDASLAMDARAVEAGRAVGANIDYAIQPRTSNSIAAHALVAVAREEGGAALQARVVDALFCAYFEQGRDIGDLAELEDIAVQSGMTDGAVGRALSRRDAIRADVDAILAKGLSGVPSYLVGGRLLFSGSQSVQGYIDRLARAADAQVLARHVGAMG